jgi:serine/threonine protein phosphatase PrpC
MEDAHITTEVDLPDGKKGMLFAVFDGHGGKEVAIYSEKHFKRIFVDQPTFKSKNYKEALRKTFFDIDALIGKEEYGVHCGTTACVVFFTDS